MKGEKKMYYDKFRLYQGGLLIREEDVDYAQRADLWPGNLYGIAGAGLIDLPVLEDCVGDDLGAVAKAVNDMLFKLNPVGLACGEIMAIDEYDIVYDPAGKRFLSTHDLDNDPVYIDHDGNDWRYSWLPNPTHIIEVEEAAGSLDTWDGRQWRHEEVGYHADYYRIDRLDGEPVDDKVLLRYWSQWDGDQPSGEIISEEELEEIKAKAGE
jgi:hypothetical protein